MTPAVAAPEAPRRERSLLGIWHRLFRQSEKTTPPGSLKPASAREWDRIARVLEDCATANDGEAAARERISRLIAFYRGAGDADKRTLFERLCARFGPREDEVAQAIERYRQAADPLARTRAEGELLARLDSPRLRILTQFNLLPHGVHALVDLRADMLRLAKDDRYLALEQDIMRLFAGWFDVGFLELKRIGWESPAALLEKLIRYEAVHEITSWSDLRNRLDSDRRCYAFFHNRMPDEPLIFVEVALVREIADNVQALLDESQPTLDPADATTAIFYSISNTQPGLKGVSMGEFLIKRVVQQLLGEYPRLRTFATLSPVPGFGRWLERKLADPAYADTLPPELAAQLPEGKDARADLVRHWVAGERDGDQPVRRKLRTWLQAECAHYLLAEKSGAAPLDPVARFHFSNGASLAQINWLGDRSSHGLRQSLTLMVNYLYKIDQIEANHGAYARDGSLAASTAVQKLFDEARQRRPRA